MIKEQTVVAGYEAELDDFDAEKRKVALQKIIKEIDTGTISLSPTSSDVNVHCHTFFSYNCYGYSPSKLAYLAKKAGLAVAGIVDFDVLDGVQEFLDASELIGMKASVGIETRVYVPEFGTKVINSPGEPGVSYHMGVGLNKPAAGTDEDKFFKSLSDTAQKRNRELIERVNTYLAPASIDIADAAKLTPKGNITERHIVQAYARKARQVFKDDESLKKFWSEKLGTKIEDKDIPESASLMNGIRAKTMKRGGVGYVQPDGGSFPSMAKMNQFVMACGGIPTVAWLDGTSDGEKNMEELLDVAISSGAAAFNIIPDRNFTPGVKDQKLANLNEVVRICRQRELPIFVGTEMNSPGNKFVDAFGSDELSPFVDDFLKGAYIAYAHTALQNTLDAGYLSKWASKNFANVADKNVFFTAVGKKLEPANIKKLRKLSKDVSPEQILKML
jgi:hypothetical protein